MVLRTIKAMVSFSVDLLFVGYCGMFVVMGVLLLLKGGILLYGLF